MIIHRSANQGSLPVLLVVLGASVVSLGVIITATGQETGLQVLGMVAVVPGFLLVVRGIASCQSACWFFAEGSLFGFGWKSVSRRGEERYPVADYVGVDRSAGRVCLLLRNEERVKLPPALTDEVGTIDTILRRLRDVGSRAEASAGPTKPGGWSDLLSQQSSEAAACRSARKAKIDDSSALGDLICQYRAAVVFREALPSAIEMARMFIDLKRSNGGLVLFGVKPDGTILGLPDDEEARARQRLEHLASELTTARVEIGRIELGGKVALFAIFNPIPAHLRPLDSFERATSRVGVV